MPNMEGLNVRSVQFRQIKQEVRFRIEFAFLVKKGHTLGKKSSKRRQK